MNLIFNLFYIYKEIRNNLQNFVLYLLIFHIGIEIVKKIICLLDVFKVTFYEFTT